MATTTHSSPLYLKRTIHPVGQGAFYSEQFYNKKIETPLFTAVYDCGGYKSELQREIKTLSRLDAVFISHFHNDHTNGLLDLKAINSNALVIIPGISHARFIVDLISAVLRTSSVSSPTVAFMLACIPALKSKKAKSTIKFQMPPEQGCCSAGKEEILVVPTGTRTFVRIESSFKWIYEISYNESDISKETALIRALAEILPSLKELLSDIDTYRDSEWYEKNLLPDLSAIIDDFGKVKKVYSDTFGKDHNSYSMFVYSHSENNLVKNSDCLYTGDAERSVANEKYIQSVGAHYIQVPHHGSSHNHSANYYVRRQIAFMSVGKNNTYGHPGRSTIIDTTRICPYIHIITEDSNSKFKQRFIL